MKTLHKVMVATVATVAFAGAAFAATQSIGTGISLNGNKATGSDFVTVSGTVAPTLTMTVTGTALDFGNLNLGVANTLTGATTVSVLSNATSFSVAASFADLGRVGGGATIPLTVDGLTNVGGNVINQGSYSETAVTKNIDYVATPVANQMAGSYGTTVTYSVTANY